MDSQIVAYTLNGEPVEIAQPVELGFSLGKFFKRIGKRVVKLTKKAWIPIRNATVKVVDTISQKYTGVKLSSVFKDIKHGKRGAISAPVQISRSRYGTPIVPPPERYSHPQTPQPQHAAMMSRNMLPLLIGAGIALYMWGKK
ncbi:hypothetical protein [Desulfurobacterium sp.]